MNRSQEIREAMLRELAEHDIEPTDEHQLIFLQGLQDGWREDPDRSFEKSLYQITLSGMISMQRLKVNMQGK